MKIHKLKPLDSDGMCDQVIQILFGWPYFSVFPLCVFQRLSMKIHPPLICVAYSRFILKVQSGQEDECRRPVATIDIRVAQEAPKVRSSQKNGAFFIHVAAHTGT